VRLGELAGERDGGRDQRAAVDWALDPEPAVECGKPVREPKQTAPVGPGASHAVVAHLDCEDAVLDACRDRGAACTGVFRDVGERLGDDEVGGCRKPDRPRSAPLGN
jgi:hypothetical protein